MSQEPYASGSPDTHWAPSLDSEPDAPPAAPLKPAVDTSPLSTVTLWAAGVSALNLLLTFACTIAWLIDEQMGLSIVAASNDLWLLLGIAGLVLGVRVQRSQKKAGLQGGTAGTIAVAAMLSSICIMSGAVMLPMISAIRSLIGPSS